MNRTDEDERFKIYAYSALISLGMSLALSYTLYRLFFNDAKLGWLWTLIGIWAVCTLVWMWTLLINVVRIMLLRDRIAMALHKQMIDAGIRRPVILSTNPASCLAAVADDDEQPQSARLAAALIAGQLSQTRDVHGLIAGTLLNRALFRAIDSLPRPYS